MRLETEFIKISTEGRDNAGTPRVARPLSAVAHPSAAPPDYEF